MALKWVLVAIAFIGDVPVDSKIFGRNDATREECEAAKKDLVEVGPAPPKPGERAT